jgi:hypothetical protein
MSTFRNSIAAVLSLTAVAGAVSVPARAQATCDWYGRQALKQQQDNVEKKCGFTGPEWSADLKAHLTWCASVAPDVSKKAVQQRDIALAGCTPK